jgi:4-oxalocrotonate tautomerase
MPIVQISLLEGRDPSLVKQCIKEIARTIHETLDAPLESIRVIATIVPAQYWAVGDRTKDEASAARDGEK